MSYNSYLGMILPNIKKGQAGGVATLNSSGKVPAQQLPSYVDEVIQYSTKSNFPLLGEQDKIYIDLSDGIAYRWSGTTYFQMGNFEVDSQLSSASTNPVQNKVVNQQITDIKSDLEESVRYDISQIKTDEEQTRARRNIGLTEDKILTFDVKNTILDIFEKVMFIDQSGKQAFKNLRNLFFYSDVTENDIMSMFGVTLDGNISEGNIPISSVPASGAMALTFSPSIKHIRGQLGHASASYAHNHLYIFRVVDADTLYGVINNRCVVLTLDRSTNSYSVAFNDNIATLNMIKNRPNTYLELEIIDGVLYAYDEDGEVEMSVTNANCIGIWANSGTGVPTITLAKMGVAHRILTMKDVDSSVGYTDLNINNGSVSVAAQNTYSALVLSATSIRSIFTLLYNNVETTTLPYIVYKKLNNGNLNAHSGGTNYLLTLDSSTNKYIGTTSTNSDVIVASRNRTSRKMQFDLVDGVFYAYTPTDGLLFMINNANCIGIWTANNTGGNGNLGVFEVEVQE